MMEIPVQKNKEYIVDIIDYGTNGEGIAKIDGFTIFIKNALKGEKCLIHITKVLTTHAFAKLVNVIEKSVNREENIDCLTYKMCGGCTLRHIKYDETLKIKKEKVQNLANKMLKENIEVNDTIGMENPYFYRNKAIYPVSKDKKIGIYKERSHDIIPIEECKIQTILSQKIAKYVAKNWKSTIYDEKNNTGVLRNIMIREGFKTNEVMLVLVLSSSFKKEYLDIQKLLETFKEIKTIVANINDKKTSVILSNINEIIYGSGFIYDNLDEFKFKISPNSFYQVNPVQTIKIYKKAINEANLKKDDVLCDLYCGIGTIGIFASKFVKKVYGIEIVKDAIKDAKENAKINNVQNISFIEGDVESAFNELLNKNIKPNVVIVDPPRKGLDNKTIENLNNLKLDRLVYISCNPATLMRDLSLLEENYQIKNITPIDNFCYSSHVESVASLISK